MKPKIIHICIRVFNLEKSIQFYQEALGFHIARTLDFPEAKFTLVFLENESSPLQIELTYNYEQKETYELGTGYGHIAFETQNLEELHTQHREKGYQITDIYTLGESTTRMYFLRDPDGYKIELLEAK